MLLFIKKILFNIILLNLVFSQSIEISHKLVNENELFNCPLFIYDAIDLESITLDIRYDKDIIISEGITLDPFGLLGNGYQYSSNISTPGQIIISVYASSVSTSDLFSGSLMLANMSFRSIGYLGETSDLSIVDLEINNSNSIIKKNGSVEIIIDQVNIYIKDDLNNNSDFIKIGMCENCSDSWKYGEDEYDLISSLSEYINIHIYHFDWLGLIDENGVTCCDNYKFASDFMQNHGYNQLLRWGISGGSNGLSSESNIELSWDDLNFGDNSSNKIFLFIGDDVINMKEQNNIIIEQTDLQLINNVPNIWIKIGACADTGITKTYYNDFDGDGFGSGDGIEYCEDLQPEDLVDNNNDEYDIPCDGILDCLGICGGTAELDNCGNCIAISETNCLQGCDGIWENEGSETIEDECGVCGGDQFDGDTDGDNSLCETECSGALDCEGSCNGNAIEDECGICGGNNFNCDTDFLCDCEGCLDQNACNYNPNNLILNSSLCQYSNENYDCNNECITDIDCAGSCGGSAIIDVNCGICIGGDTGLEPCQQDCNGIWGGLSTIDECEICDNDPSNDNLDQDCEGVCFGNAYIDNCGRCVQSETSTCVQGCDGIWSIAGFETIEDECGVCGGVQFDQDIDGDGNICETECESTLDCAGECGGTAFIDTNCNICVGGSTGLDPCQQDCNGIWGGLSSIDECGICDNDSDNDNINLDCNNICDPETAVGAEQQQSGYEYGAILDDCGNCVTIGEQVVCEQDCQGVWGGNHIPAFPCNGTYVCTPSECVLDINYNTMIREFKIDKIFPNPFNPKATINYEVFESGNINIDIYNIRGQKVDVLLNQFVFPGKYSISWNGLYFPAGIYFVILNSNKTVIKEKMILLK